nr:hypothetical protein [Tanacetum cinerariifolium]
MSNENHDPNILNDITNVSGSSQTTHPTRRRGRPGLCDRVVRLNNTEVTQPLQLSPQQVLPQSPLNSRSNGLTRNDDHINMSTHSTPRVMLSSVTIVDTYGNPVHHTQLPTETALVPGNGNPTECRDVIVEERRADGGHNPVKCIFELHLSFMALQYPLLFPYREDGFQLEIPLNVHATTKRKYMSLREYYCVRLQCRTEKGKTLHKAGRLFHTYCVDAYTAVLDHDLDWYKRNQNTIRSELYHGLHDRIASGETNIQSLGRKFILPSTFTGGPRHMIQQYQDAMAICHWAGPPDLFVTMTCNPKWPEIERDVENYIPCQPAADRPDTITRVLKMKLDDLMEDIQKGHHFGRVKADLVDVHQSVLLYERITHLYLSYCDSLQILPSSMYMKSLQTLHLNGCMNLDRFPK